MRTVIFTNIVSIENKISQSENKYSFEQFFNHAGNYEAYCERLITDLSIGDRVRYLTLKKENLEAMQQDIPTVISNNETSLLKSIQDNLDAIEANIISELTITKKALLTAQEEEKKTLKSS